MSNEFYIVILSSFRHYNEVSFQVFSVFYFVIDMGVLAKATLLQGWRRIRKAIRGVIDGGRNVEKWL